MVKKIFYVLNGLNLLETILYRLESGFL